jgi:hypothetical protein
MSLVENFGDAELTNLQFITHRLAIVASPAVLDEYQNFLKVITSISADNSFSGDRERLSEALGRLTVEIREDLVGKISRGRYTEQQIRKMITSNSSRSSEMVRE